MSSYAAYLSLYPAIASMVGDASTFWSGSSVKDKERILAHRLKETQEKLDALSKLLEAHTPSVKIMRDASTQTDDGVSEV